MPSRRTALAVAAAANIVWAGSYVAGKDALDDVPVVTLNCLRFAIASVVLVPLCWRYRRALPRDRAGVLRLIALAALGFVANKALEYAGLSLTTATDTALLITTESLVTLVLAVLVLRERLQPLAAMALALGSLGVYVLVEGGLVVPHRLSGPMATGDLLVVASLAIEAGATIVGAQLMRRGSPYTVTAAAVCISLLAWGPAELVVGLRDGAPHLSARGWAGLLYLALFTTCIGYGAWFWALQHVPAQDVTPLLLVQPVAGTVLASLLRGERPTAATLIGGALVLAGVALVALPRGARPARPVELAALARESP